MVITLRNMSVALQKMTALMEPGQLQLMVSKTWPYGRRTKTLKTPQENPHQVRESQRSSVSVGLSARHWRKLSVGWPCAQNVWTKCTSTAESVKRKIPHPGASRARWAPPNYTSPYQVIVNILLSRSPTVFLTVFKGSIIAPQENHSREVRLRRFSQTVRPAGSFCQGCRRPSGRDLPSQWRVETPGPGSSGTASHIRPVYMEPGQGTVIQIPLTWAACPRCWPLMESRSHQNLRNKCKRVVL